MSLNKKASLLFLISVILFLSLSGVLGLFGGVDPNLFFLLNSLAVSVPSFLIPAIFFRRKFRLPRSGVPDPVLFVTAIGIGIGCIFLNQALSYLTEALFGSLRVVSNSTTAETIMGLDVWVMIIALAIVPPVSEELMMRGTLLECWRRYAPVGALILTSLLFGLLHAAPSSIIIYFGLGLLLGAVYLITRNVWLCMIVHLINNLVSVIGAVAMKGMPEGATEIGLESVSWLGDSSATYMILFVIGLVVAGIILAPLLISLKYRCSKKKLGMYAEKTEEAQVPHEGEEGKSMWNDAILWLTILLLVLINVFSGLIEFGVIKL